MDATKPKEAAQGYWRSINRNDSAVTVVELKAFAESPGLLDGIKNRNRQKRLTFPSTWNDSPSGGQSMYPLTLQSAIMRHMLNLAKDMASDDLLESRKKLEEYPLCGDPSVFDHIMRARAVQDRMWGREVDDTKNDPWRWSTYISHCAARWLRDPHKWTREDTDDFYDAMIETAAICAAAAESVVRQRNTNGRTFYEPALGTAGP